MTVNDPLRSIAARIENVQNQIDDLNADKAELFKEAKGVGLDVRALKEALRARRNGETKWENLQEIVGLYLEKLNTPQVKQNEAASRTRTREEPAPLVHAHEAPVAEAKQPEPAALVHAHETVPAATEPLVHAHEAPAPEPVAAPKPAALAFRWPRPERAKPAEEGIPAYLRRGDPANAWVR